MNRKHNPVPKVYLYRQGDFDAIPGSPWVYWITPGLRRVFEELPKLEEVAKPRQGLATADNFRFLRFWWEVGVGRIGFGCKSREEAASSGKKWFPYMKGGEFRRWWGNQEYVVNWWKDGAEIRNLGIETGRVASRPQNTDFYFRRGVTYSAISSKSFSVRFMPEGFIIGHKGSAIFSNCDRTLFGILGILNSKVATVILEIISPTIDFNVGQLNNFPLPETISEKLIKQVEKAIELAKKDAEEDETTWDFVAPPEWPGTRKDERGTMNDERGIMNAECGRRNEEQRGMGPEERSALLAEIERQIDEEVYRLYEISAEDRRAIEEELGMMNDE